MKNKTTIKTNGREIVAVELLEGAYGFAISDWVNGYTVLDYQYEDGDLEYQILSNSKQEYKIIGILSESIAEQIMPRYNFQTFRAWLQCKGVDITKPLLIIEKLK